MGCPPFKRFWGLGLVIGLGSLAVANDDLDRDLASLTTEANAETNQVLAEEVTAEDEEINVRELLDEQEGPVSTPAAEGISAQDRFKAFLPCKIFQSTNSAFVRTLHKNGTVTRTYTPEICQGISGEWKVEGATLQIKERIRCLVDPDQPGKYGRAWSQKVQFTIDYAKGRPTLNGIWQGKDQVFQLN